MSDDYNKQLQEAIRRRLLEEIGSSRGGQAITNNVYGGGLTGGVRGQMSGEGEDMPMPKDERDYFVDILREDLPEINEATGKPKGWRKKVHRFTTARGEDPEKKN